jgi:hypothetical protein
LAWSRACWSVRDGCTPGNCPAFALLTDPGRVAVNLAGRSYELYVERHAAAWPAGAKSPVVAATGAATNAGEGRCAASRRIDAA